MNTHIRNIRDIAILSAPLALIYFISKIYYHSILIDSGFYSFTSLSKPWFDLVNFSHNAFFKWSFNFPLNYFLDNGSYIFYMAVNYTLYCIGSYLWFRQVYDSSNTSSLRLAISSLILVLLSFYLFALDTVIVSCLSWFPWLCWSLGRCLKETNFTNSLFALLTSWQLAMSANQLSIVLFAFGLAVTAKKIPAESRVQYNLKTIVLLALCLLPILYVLISAPSPSIAAYPHSARVVPDDGIAGDIRPLIGAESLLALVDRSFMRYANTLLSLPLLVLIVLSFAFFKSTHTQQQSLGLKTASLLTLLLLLDCSLIPESVSQIAPLATLSRLIPGLFFFPLAPLCWALALLYLALTYASKPAIWSLSAIFILFSISSSSGTVFPIRPAALKLNQSEASFREFLNLSSREKRAKLESYLISPSYYTIKHSGLWVLSDPIVEESYEQFSPRRWEHKIDTSHQIQDRHLVADRVRKTRWSPSIGRQNGDEWIHLYLNQAQNISGVILNPGEFSTDFPRGLRISYSRECSANQKEPNFAKYTQVYKSNNWQGPLRYTKSGHPYYGPQSTVKVIFSTEVEMNCLLIEQIGKDDNFDWSVAEIRLLKRKQLATTN